MAVELDNLNGKDRAVIEALSRDEGMPFDQVSEIYRIECVQLEEVARIKTFVSVIASRRTRNRLRALKESKRRSAKSS
jgi:hypothetical protein